MVELLKNLTEYGAIGLISIIALAWAWRLYRDMKVMQERHQQQMDALRERYIAKAESWMSKFYEIAQAQTEVLDAIERRYGRTP